MCSGNGIGHWIKHFPITPPDSSAASLFANVRLPSGRLWVSAEIYEPLRNSRRRVTRASWEVCVAGPPRLRKALPPNEARLDTPRTLQFHADYEISGRPHKSPRRRGITSTLRTMQCPAMGSAYLMQVTLKTKPKRQYRESSFGSI